MGNRLRLTETQSAPARPTRATDRPPLAATRVDTAPLGAVTLVSPPPEHCREAGADAEARARDPVHSDVALASASDGSGPTFDPRATIMTSADVLRGSWASHGGPADDAARGAARAPPRRADMAETSVLSPEIRAVAPPAPAAAMAVRPTTPPRSSSGRVAIAAAFVLAGVIITLGLARGRWRAPPVAEDPSGFNHGSEAVIVSAAAAAPLPSASSDALWTGGVTIERAAVDAVAQGAFAQAAVLYGRLAREHPDSGVYTAAARIAARKADAGPVP